MTLHCQQPSQGGWAFEEKLYIYAYGVETFPMVIPLPRTLGETFRFSEAIAAGVSEPTLRELVADGRIERVARGLYRRANARLADLDRIEVARKAPMGTICLVSALAQHDLSDEIPTALDVAVPRGAWHPRVSAPVRWHSFAAETFDVDRTQVRLDSSTTIGLYGPRRSIVDAFRLAHQVGPEVGVEALRRWLGTRGHTPALLLEVAAQFPRVQTELTRVLRVLL